MLGKTTLILLVGVLAACGETSGTRDAGASGDRGLILDDQGVQGDQSQDDTVAPSCGTGIYPCGPYGLTAGSVIENHQFDGFTDPQEHCKPNQQKVLDTSKTVKLALKDWYRGDSSCPTQKKKLLWILGSASWCGICKKEIAQVQAAYSAGQVDARVGFINVVIDGLNVGAPPTEAVTKSWATANNLTFPVARDATRSLAKYFSTSSFPLNVLVDTSNMKIYFVQNGVTLATVGGKITQFFSGK